MVVSKDLLNEVVLEVRLERSEEPAVWLNGGGVQHQRAAHAEALGHHVLWQVHSTPGGAVAETGE